MTKLEPFPFNPISHKLQVVALRPRAFVALCAHVTELQVVTVRFRAFVAFSAYVILESQVMEEHASIKKRWVFAKWIPVIVAASMLFFESSTYRCSGIFYVMIMEEFAIARGPASWPITVLAALSDLGGKKTIVLRNLSFSFTRPGVVLLSLGGPSLHV